MITFRNTAVFFLAFFVLGFITTISNLSASETDFEVLLDSTFSGDTVALDNPSSNTGNIGTVIDIPKSPRGWSEQLIKVATFDAPIWGDGFGYMAKVVLATIGAAYVLALIVKGLELVAAFIPG